MLLTEIQKGWPGKKEIPHGFTSLGSVWLAIPEMAETKFVWWYELVCATTGATVEIEMMHRMRTFSFSFKALAPSCFSGARARVSTGARGVVRKRSRGCQMICFPALPTKGNKKA